MCSLDLRAQDVGAALGRRCVRVALGEGGAHEVDETLGEMPDAVRRHRAVLHPVQQAEQVLAHDRADPGLAVDGERRAAAHDVDVRAQQQRRHVDHEALEVGLALDRVRAPTTATR